MNPQVIAVMSLYLLFATALGFGIGFYTRHLTLLKRWKTAELEWDHHLREQVRRRDASIMGLEHRLAEAQKLIANIHGKTEEEFDAHLQTVRQEGFAQAVTENQPTIDSLHRELASKTKELERVQAILDGHREEIRHLNTLMGRPMTTALVEIGDPSHETEEFVRGEPRKEVTQPAH